MQANDRISRTLAFAVRLRGPLLAMYAVLVTGAVYRATRIPSEGGIDRLIVPSDPDYAATRAFQRIFPETQTVLVLLESEEAWSPSSIARVESAKAALRVVTPLTAFSVLDPLLFALRNKFLPVTASLLAAAMGLAALVVSSIRPIREMGLWTALGLLISWVVAFTLFPALQLVLRTPTGRSVPVRVALYDRLASSLPAFTYRHRWVLAAGGLGVCVAGAAALFGVPGVVGGMSVSVDTLEYLDPSTALHGDLQWFRRNVMDLNVARVWIHLPGPLGTDPEVLQAVDRFQGALESLPDVTAVTGPTTPLRMRSYLAGRGEALPADPEGFARAAGDVEQLLITQRDLRGFIDVKGLSDLQLTVQFRHGDARGYAALSRSVGAAWEAVRAGNPALRGAEMRVVGEALLQAKVGAGLVPTFAESFLLTVALIFTVFLFLFRSGLERLLAMIPSLFALLATFLGMRLL